MKIKKFPPKTEKSIVVIKKMAALNQKETNGKQISCGTKTVGDVPDAIMFHNTGCENTKKIK